MDSCCENKAGELAQLRSRQSRVLYIALAINAVMFGVEFTAGWLADSTALLGDSLDMFGDASVYALTLFVLHRSDRARASAALVKGGFMLLFGLVVVADAVRKVILQEVPQADWMGTIGLVALLANTYCFYLLYSHRADDLNMRSTWICSRNDLVANASVVLAAILVTVTGSLWPDILVGLAIAALFLHSAWQVSREAYGALHLGSQGQGAPAQERQSASPQEMRLSSCCGDKALAVIAEPETRASAAPCCASANKGDN
nr:cation diffusion facilitator family transporter [uncultured Pseudomonas sp.]